MAKRIADIITEERVLLPLEGSGKEQAIDRLIQFLLKAYDREDPVDRISNCVWERENRFSTGIGRGIAIPHGEIDDSIEPMAVLGITANPIEYEAIDDEPVSLFFLLVCSKSRTEERLEVLSSLSNLLRDRSVCERLMRSKTSAEVVNIILETEGTDR